MPLLIHSWASPPPVAHRRAGGAAAQGADEAEAEEEPPVLAFLRAFAALSPQQQVAKVGLWGVMGAIIMRIMRLRHGRRIKGMPNCGDSANARALLRRGPRLRRSSLSAAPAPPVHVPAVLCPARAAAPAPPAWPGGGLGAAGRGRLGRPHAALGPRCAGGGGGHPRRGRARRAVWVGCWVVGLLVCCVVGLLGCWVVGCWFVGRAVLYVSGRLRLSSLCRAFASRRAAWARGAGAGGVVDGTPRLWPGFVGHRSGFVGGSTPMCAVRPSAWCSGCASRSARSVQARIATHHIGGATVSCVLCCAVLCCAVLCCAVLCCAVR
jgi:hypothetical protein